MDSIHKQAKKERQDLAERQKQKEGNFGGIVWVNNNSLLKIPTKEYN